MTNTIRIQGRDLTATDLSLIRQLIADNPSWSRRKLSIVLCEVWDWRNARGDLKDMASRTLMLKLHERGEICLPERRQVPSNRMQDRVIPEVPHSTTAIHEKLSAIQPLRVITVLPGSEDEALYNHLLATHHYLSYKSSVGENMKYLVRDKYDRPLACLLFGSSAWASSARDKHLSWSPETRQHNINFTSNNTRFLILPWVQVAHAASHILGMISRRIQQDWINRYHHPIYLIETFVDQSRFKGTCYKAANWFYCGNTQGRSRNDRHHSLSVPLKAVFIYPLVKNYRAVLSTKIQTCAATK